MNRPQSAAFAALLLSVVIVVPAAAEQAPIMLQPAVSEFCSGCFAYLEFPSPPQARAAAEQAPLTLARAVRDEFCSGCFAYLEFPPPPQAEATSTLTSARQDTLPPATAAQKIPTAAPAQTAVASAKR